MAAIGNIFHQMNKVGMDTWKSTRRIGLCIKYSTELPGGDSTAFACMEGNIPQIVVVPSSKATEVFRFVIGSEPFYFKRFLLRGPGDFLKHLVKPSRAERACRAHELLLQLGFSTPDCLALVEKQALRYFILQSALISRSVEDKLEVGSLLEQLSLGSLSVNDSQVKQRLLRALGTEVGRLHAAGVYHGDSNHRNLLVSSELEKPFEFTWLDNERVRCFGKVPLKKRANNLRQLNKVTPFLSNRDRIRVWRAYKSSSGLSKLELAKLRVILLRVLAKKASNSIKAS